MVTEESIVQTAIPEAPEGYVYAGPVSDFLPVPEQDLTTAGIIAVKTPVKEQGESEPESKDISAEVKSSPIAEGKACLGSTHSSPDYVIKVVEVQQPPGRYPAQRRVAVSYYHKKWYAFLNICPHQGSALSRGTMTDIEDMGIVWGAGVTCSLHGWTFDALSGQSDSTRFVIDTYDIKELDGHVFVSQKPRNAHVGGQRRDFGGREMN